MCFTVFAFLRSACSTLPVRIVRDGADRISFVALNSLSFIPLCALEVTCCVSAVAGDKRVRPPPPFMSGPDIFFTFSWDKTVPAISTLIEDNMDHHFWNLIREGDEHAFRTLYNLYEDRLFRYGMGIAYDEELINHAIQTLFTYLFERRRSISVPVSPFAYLASSLRRLVLKEVGKRRNDCLSIDDVQVSGYDFDLEIDAEATMVRAECTEQTIRALQGALNGLTNMQREIIYLKYYEGLDNKSISEITGYADKTIRNVASTALARLRKDKMLGQAYG